MDGMKKTSILLALSAGLLAFASCNVLDLTAVDEPTSSTFWKSEAQVQTFLNGLYDDLRNVGSYPFVLGETRGGTLKTGSSSEGESLDYANYITQTLSASVAGTSSWWGFYSNLLIVNQFIYKLEKECTFLSDAARSSYLAPAYGIRAYYYFLLYRTYGGVILETEPKVLMGGVSQSDYYMGRSSAQETLQFIKDDLERNEKAFGTNRDANAYKWNYYVTQMLKAQVYLWSSKVETMFQDKAKDTSGSYKPQNKEGDLKVAKEALETIVKSQKYRLMEQYSDIFDFDHKANAEVIFALYYNMNEATNGFSTMLYQVSLWVGNRYGEDATTAFDNVFSLNGGVHRVEYLESFVRSYDKEDSRREAIFLEYYDKPAGAADRAFGSVVKKYLGQVYNQVRYSDADVILFRYADVLLTLAEVENDLGNSDVAASYINEVRARAYGNNSHAYTAGSQAEVELTILKERDKELVAEGSRWFDLIRMKDASGKPLVFSAAAAYPETNGGTATPVLSSAQAHMVLWPVSRTVMENDENIAQTYGYSDL